MKALFLAPLLAGCAAFPLSESACRPADWRARGYHDGYFGHPPQDMRLAPACARYGVRLSQAEYLAGWRDGHDEWDRLMGSVGPD